MSNLKQLVVTLPADVFDRFMALGEPGTTIANLVPEEIPPPADTADLTYKELQALARARGLPWVGKSLETLREALSHN